MDPVQPWLGNTNLLTTRRPGVRNGSPGPAWGRGRRGDAPSTNALPSTRQNPPTATRDPRIKFWSASHSPSFWITGPHAQRVQGSTEGLAGPHAQHSHGPEERFPAWTAESNADHLLTCTPGLPDQSPFPFSCPLVPRKALTCSTLSVRQRKDSSGSSVQERPPKCAGDELLAPVTPTPKPCQGSEKSPRRALLPPASRTAPSLGTRWEERGADAAQPAFSFKSSSASCSPLPPSTVAPAEIRNWSWREWTGALPARRAPAFPLGAGSGGLDLGP